MQVAIAADFIIGHHILVLGCGWKVFSFNINANKKQWFHTNHFLAQRYKNIISQLNNNLSSITILNNMS